MNYLYDNDYNLGVTTGIEHINKLFEIYDKEEKILKDIVENSMKPENQNKESALMKMYNEYYAHLYFFSEVKKELKNQLITRKNRLQKRYNLIQEKFENTDSLEVDKRKKLAYGLGAIEGNLSFINNKLNDIEFTQDEIDFFNGKKSLTSDQQSIYDDIDKSCLYSGKTFAGLDENVNQEEPFQAIPPERALVEITEEPVEEIPIEQALVEIPEESVKEITEEEPVEELTEEEPTEEITEEEPIEEVVEMTPWEKVKGWVGKNKKKILITLGLTALTIAVALAITKLAPALLAKQMLINGGKWGASVASEQIALHSANTGLANLITALTGKAAIFNSATGIWSIGGSTIQAIAASASTLGTTILAGGGLATLTAGIWSKNRTDEYIKINKRIKELKSRIEDVTEEELVQNYNELDDIITNSNQLKRKEKSLLLSKLKNLVKKKKSIIDRENTIDNQIEEPNNMEFVYPENTIENQIEEPNNMEFVYPENTTEEQIEEPNDMVFEYPEFNDIIANYEEPEGYEEVRKHI